MSTFTSAMDVSLLLDQENGLNHCECFVDNWGGFGAGFCETASGVLEGSTGSEG